jgi:hypothetical protein
MWIVLANIATHSLPKSKCGANSCPRLPEKPDGKGRKQPKNRPRTAYPVIVSLEEIPAARSPCWTTQHSSCGESNSGRVQINMSSKS